MLCRGSYRFAGLFSIVSYGSTKIICMQAKIFVDFVFQCFIIESFANKQENEMNDDIGNDDTLLDYANVMNYHKRERMTVDNGCYLLAFIDGIWLMNSKDYRLELVSDECWMQPEYNLKAA